MEKIRKIFIDCGVWTGDSIKEFKKYYNDYEIYGFECEPRLKDELEILKDVLGFVFLNKAVWSKDEILKFYLGQEDLTQSSSLLKEKKKYINKSKPVEVEAIDFSYWLKSNFKKDDYIICKMNIEGAEYPVLEKMIKDDTISYINKLFISWHWRKLNGFSKEKHDQIEASVKKKTDVKIWTFVEGKAGNPFI